MSDVGAEKGNGRDLPGRPSKSKLWTVLLDDDLDAAVLRLAHTVGGLDQEARLAAADHGNRGGRHAFTHQRVLDRVRATQRQRHV